MQARSCVVMMLGALTLVGVRSLEAQTATQVVRFRVLAASRAAVEPVKAPLPARGTSSVETRYAIGTTEPNRKILASLDRTVPGVALTVRLTPPAGATAAGPVVLDTVATDLLTGIPVAMESGLPVRYTLAADAPAPIAPDERALMVRYTVVEGP